MWAIEVVLNDIGVCLGFIRNRKIKPATLHFFYTIDHILDAILNPTCPAIIVPTFSNNHLSVISFPIFHTLTPETSGREGPGSHRRGLFDRCYPNLRLMAYSSLHAPGLDVRLMVFIAPPPQSAYFLPPTAYSNFQTIIGSKGSWGSTQRLDGI